MRKTNKKLKFKEKSTCFFIKSNFYGQIYANFNFIRIKNKMG